MMPTGTFNFSSDPTAIIVGISLLLLAILCGYIIYRHSKDYEKNKRNYDLKETIPRKS